MGSRHHSGEWKRICVPCILFLLAVIRQCDATEEQNIFNKTVSCQENEYLHTGFCCDKCSPGFKLKQKCSGEGRRSVCEKCSTGTYQDHTNHFINCFSCRKECDSTSKEIEIAPCTHMQDRICGCEAGYYKNVINEITMSCDPCRKCGDGEREIRPCEGERNTECECKDNHYHVAKGICAQCTNCSSKCRGLCRENPTTNPTTVQQTGLPLHTAFMLFVFMVISSLVCFIIIGVKYLKRIQTVYRQSSIACDPEKQVGQTETTKCVQAKEVEQGLLAGQQGPVLPDCVPTEIKTHEFIYFVLGLVPVNRFKELVRRLDVSEQDIGRAERDNRAFADAQYQMLMVWVESGTRGGKSILPFTLLQECVNTLKDMNLTTCAETIEDKYASKKTSLSYF
ncbi:tumor necrosis factor receptor superfamily member 1A [Tachysurus vachellii]|uniref:tumor necrosis factor receptor superfamily member 1A n=1 Tax=Tachysurus vachellii TaxID=175792 RepID=UPI00296AB24E|nr:tumor necrosis factor receptor superfamily member 1A [Tachysurus vachellii]